MPPSRSRRKLLGQPSKAQPTLHVRNRTGVTQTFAGTDIVVGPGEWADLPRRVAMNLVRQRLFDLDLPQDEAKYQWKDGDGNLKFLWMSPFSQGDGYATAAENMVYSLLQVGATPFVRHCWFLVAAGLRPETLELVKQPMDELYRVGICMATPGEFAKLPTPFKIGWTMYETTNPLIEHPEWVHQCNEVDHLLVPCEWTRQVFKKFVKRPVTALPLAIHEGYLLRPDQQPKIASDTFTFITYATLSGRKSPLETMKLFHRVFPKDKYPDVRIRFKTRQGMLGLSHRNFPHVDDPRIEIVDETWFQSQMREFLDQADCMLFLSKGEGFGMPPREAMAAGVPTILSNSTGMSSVCDSRYNWPIPANNWETSPLGGKWAIPDWDYAADAMRWVYENREEAYQKAYDGAKWIAAYHGPLAAAEELMQFLYRLDARVEPQTVSTPPPDGDLNSHRKRFEHIYQRVLGWYPDTTKAVYSISLNSGAPHVVLSDLGYNVDSFVLGDDSAVETAIRQVSITDVQGMVYQASPFSLDGRYRKALRLSERPVVVAVDVLSSFSPLEVPRLIHNWLDLADAVIFAVPSVYYPKRRFVDEHLLRSEQWLNVLSNFLIKRIEYFGGKENRDYLLCWVVKDDGNRGYMVKHFGREREGVWKPTEALAPQVTG